MGEHGLPREVRIRFAADFRNVYDRRCAKSDHHILIYGIQNALTHSRLGLSVSRKVGSAVERNRWKRSIREAYRSQQRSIPRGFDWIVIPRQKQPPSLKQLQASLRGLTRKLARKLEES
ncbi:MAG: ribonuclease P protein component [Pirellulales bacterium]|jgi:ribonuclease P protein component|nr:ribonuclease P protein component [Pirellulales bacterium]